MTGPILFNPDGYPECALCGARMFQQHDLDYGGMFWDCPNECDGARPKIKKPKKRKRSKESRRIDRMLSKIAAECRREEAAPETATETIEETAKTFDSYAQEKFGGTASRPICPVIVTRADGSKEICGRQSEVESSIPSQRRFCWIHGGPPAPAGLTAQEWSARYVLAFLGLVVVCLFLAWLISP